MNVKFMVAILVATFCLSSAQVPGPDQRCRGVSYAVFPAAKNDCGKFIFCEFGFSTEYECSEDEIWSQEQAACVLGDQDTCMVWDPETACHNAISELVPYPRDCTKFINCTEEEKSLVEECPPGHIFSVKDSGCVLGSEVSCETYGNLCYGQTEKIVLHPDRCDVYIECDDGNQTVSFCPEGKIFRKDVESCVPGYVEDCTLVPVEKMCQDREQGIFPHPEECGWYVLCTGNETVVEKCQKGEIFDPRNSSCAVGNVETCTLLNDVCVNATDGRMLEHPNGCDLYIKCHEEIPTIGQCNQDKILREDMQFCVPGNSTTCERAPLETMCYNLPFGVVFPHPELCSSIVQCEINKSNEIPCPEHHIVVPGSLTCIPGDPKSCQSFDKLCNGAHGEYIAHPNKCNSYIYCHKEFPSALYCPPGDIFDEDKRKCIPGDVDLCEPLKCTEENGVSVHPNFCNVFQRCNDGQMSTHLCPFEHIFHPTMHFCTPGNSSTCQLDTLEEMCQGRYDDSRYPYPVEDQCVDYVMCVNKTSVVQSCDDGMVLRPERLDCFPGNADTCELFEDICPPDQSTTVVHPSRCDIKVICSSEEPPSVDKCPEDQIVDLETLSCVPGKCPGPEPEPENQCVEKEDGIYADVSDCSKFIICKDGSMTVESCSDGEIFDVGFKICFPGTKEGCAVLPLETMCAGRPNGQRYPNPKACESYVVCQDGKAEEQSCPRGNMYRPILQRCLAGDSCKPVDVCGSAADGSVFPHPGPSCDLFIRCDTELSVAEMCPAGEIFTEESDGKCAPGNLETCQVTPLDRCFGQQDGTLIPNPESCAEYYRCQAGDSVQEPCQPGHIFNEQLGQCVPGNENGCVDYRDLCRTNPDGRIPFPDIIQCGLFVECSLGETSVQSCPSGEIFTTETNGECVPGNLETCQVIPPVVEDRCVGQPEGTLLPNPDDCAEYYRCQSEESVQERCQSGHIFNEEQGQCVPGNENGCVDYKDLCNGNPDGRIPFPDITQCGLFVECSLGKTSVQSCPPGEIFTTETNGECAPGNMETCQETPPVVEDRCIGQLDETLLPNPNSCAEYYHCQAGSSVQERCQPGHIFNELQGQCVPGNENGCVDHTAHCLGKSDGAVPFPEVSKCNLFLGCSNGETAAYSCPDGEIFSEAEQLCVAGNVDGCAITDATSDFCSNLSDGKYSHPQVCYLFVECSEGKPSVVACSLNEIFDSVSGSCREGDRRECSIR